MDSSPDCDRFTKKISQTTLFYGHDKLKTTQTVNVIKKAQTKTNDKNSQQIIRKTDLHLFPGQY